MKKSVYYSLKIEKLLYSLKAKVKLRIILRAVSKVLILIATFIIYIRLRIINTLISFLSINRSFFILSLISL